MGRETDTTIADYVADLRAPTYPGSSELAVVDYRQLAGVYGFKNQPGERVEQKIGETGDRARYLLQARLLASPHSISFRAAICSRFE